MQDIELSDLTQQLPDIMPVSVIMQKSPSDHQWLNFTYDAIGVVPNREQAQQHIKLIHQQNNIEKYLINDLNVQLYVDECESYYHNLMSPKPGCFIVADQTDDADEMPIPYLVSLSFDEVHAYLEGDAQVYAVDIPASLYQWAEAYVLTHYVATKKTKRKLTDWKQQAQGRARINMDAS